jgi:S1-C subfamily serine protease
LGCSDELILVRYFSIRLVSPEHWRFGRSSKMPKKLTTGLAVAVSLFFISATPPAARLKTVDQGKSRERDDKAYQELAEQVAELERFSRVFESIAKLVSPCVVHIQSKKAATLADRNFTMEETGSGVIVRLPSFNEPLLLTNHHVVDRVQPEQLVITTNDRRLIHAVRSWSDEASDVAVLMIHEKDSPAARLGDSDQARVGHWVLAIGSPFDQAGSVTHGIISGKGRRALKLAGDRVLNQDFIQTDASINPGNSGGPLVNLRGEIIGINTAIASQSGGSEGVGFSIPINLVRRIATELIQKGSITRAYLGIGIMGSYPQLDAQVAAKLGLSNGRGGLVQEVFPDTPAAAAGLLPLDVILEIDADPVEDVEHLTHIISLKPVGDTVSLLVWRNRQQLHVNATLGARPKPKLSSDKLSERSNPVPALANLGVAVQELTDGDRVRLNLNDQKGVLITQIMPHREAARFIEPFDVIEEIEGKPVSSVAEVREAIDRGRLQNGIRVRVARPSPDGVTRLDVTLKP